MDDPETVALKALVQLRNADILRTYLDTHSVQAPALSDALIDCARVNSLDCVNLLLAAGADPNHSTPLGETPLHQAAINGNASIAEALLAAGGNPDTPDNRGRQPLFVAAQLGHAEVASAIQQHARSARARRTSAHLKRLGWTPLAEVAEGIPLFLTGTQQPSDPESVLRVAFDCQLPASVELPLTRFEGWLKQLDGNHMEPLAQEALEATFPLFYDLDTPPERFLESIPTHESTQRIVNLSRTRRFAGDRTLPRARYYTLSADELGNDQGTLVREMLAYSNIARTGPFELYDTADPRAPGSLGNLGLEMPASPSVSLVFRPDCGGNIPFLSSASLPQTIDSILLPVRVAHDRIESVVDLRLPSTADWFSRFFSRAVNDLSEVATSRNRCVRCWPLRPPLENFGQILPSMLSQELGGGALSIVAGAWLRRAGAEALIFPSARNDPRLQAEGGVVRAARGWNLVDYRDSGAPESMLVVDVDDRWPEQIAIGPGLDMRSKLPPNFFGNPSCTYVNTGSNRGSFEAKGIASALGRARQVELQAFRDHTPMLPWFLL